MPRPVMSRVVDETAQIVAVRVAAHRGRQPQHVGRGDIAHPKRDLLDAGDHEPLALLQRLDEVRRLQERLVRPGVEPRDTPAEALDVQLARAEIGEVDVRDLQLAAVGGLERRGDVDDAVVVKVQTGHGPRRARPDRLLLEAPPASNSTTPYRCGSRTQYAKTVAPRVRAAAR